MAKKESTGKKVLTIAIAIVSAICVLCTLTGITQQAWEGFSKGLEGCSVAEEERGEC